MDECTFLFCALNSTDKQQKEVSKFNYAKLSVELGYTDVALTELKSFISSYPNSEYGTEAKELLVNELNTMPGLTEVSGYPKMWAASGLPFPRVLDRLIKLAFARHRDKSLNKTSI